MLLRRRLPSGRFSINRSSWLVAAHGNHQSAAGRKLVDQRLRHVIGRGRDQNHVERRVFRPALIAVAATNVDVRVAERGQPFARRRGQGIENLDAVDLLAQFGKDGRLIARADADLQRAVVGRGSSKLRHQRHDVRLRDRLAEPDRQRMVFVGVLSQLPRARSVRGPPGP